MLTTIPRWLEAVRRTAIVDVVHADVRSSSSDDILLGVHRSRIVHDVLGHQSRTGQADFTQPWEHLSPDDVALLYGYFLQKGHLEELSEAFGQIFACSTIENPVVVDLGCGPCTGGLALADSLGADHSFSYVGIDRAPSMHRLGDALIQAAIAQGRMMSVDVQWFESIETTLWRQPLNWRPVVVVVSYLLASPTLDALDLANKTVDLISRISWGPVAVVYTNATDVSANRQFPIFEAVLISVGFKKVVDELGSVEIERYRRTVQRSLRYALFFRQKTARFKTGGGV